MSLVTSGQIKLSDIRTEFGGGSGEISLSDFYRGGSKVRAKASNNNATNDAASVPTSGALDMSDFHGTAASFTKTFSAGATNQDASDIFGDDYSVDYAKNIVINSGVELGATSTGNEALHIDSGGSGTITVTNNGTLTGRGGAAGSAGGGNRLSSPHDAPDRPAPGAAARPADHEGLSLQGRTGLRGRPDRPVRRQGCAGQLLLDVWAGT